jgi:hypothetical protein
MLYFIIFVRIDSRSYNDENARELTTFNVREPHVCDLLFCPLPFQITSDHRDARNTRHTLRRAV